jgi:hypothetical protein
MGITLAHVADEQLLKKVWKDEVRPALRSMTFNNFNYAPDPLHYAGYEWGLQTLVSALAKDLRLGRYSPEPGEIVRMAKGKGLSRPLCFLATRDALVYSTITSLIRGELIVNAQPWVGFAHSDKGEAKVSKESSSEDSDDSFDWFRFWLARQGHILQMIDNDDVHYFVESDVANFYPSIRLEAVREHLHSQTTLEKEVVRLCVQIIDGVMPRRNYSEVSLMGLPQEHIGSSREIAHSLLLHVDEEFDREGKEGRYTRFMDDILIGVESPEAGQKCISRLQRSIESIGLYPNASKTIVTSVKSYLDESLVQVNGEVDRLDNELEKINKGMPRVITAPEELINSMIEVSRHHRSEAGKAKRWGRVTRRIYTLHRKAGIQIWWSYWYDDLEADPGAAAQILEYVRSWPLDERTLAKLIDLSVKYSDLYANLSLLAAEVISSAPVGEDKSLWGKAHTACHKEFSRLVAKSHRAPENERVAAAWLLASWKFANASQRQRLLGLIGENVDATSPIRAQALPLLVAAKNNLEEWVAAKPGLAWENALAAEYLRSLEAGSDRAVGVAISLIEPQPRLAPQRFIVLPRAIPLIEIVGNSASAKLDKSVPKFLDKLQKNPDRLRDYRVEWLLNQWAP